MQRVHWEVQGVYGPLQRSLKVNPNQVATQSLDVYLHKGPYVTLDKLLAESGIITPHRAGRSKDGPARLGKEAKNNDNC